MHHRPTFLLLPELRPYQRPHTGHLDRKSRYRSDVWRCIAHPDRTRRLSAFRYLRDVFRSQRLVQRELVDEAHRDVHPCPIENSLTFSEARMTLESQLTNQELRFSEFLGAYTQSSDMLLPLQHCSVHRSNLVSSEGTKSELSKDCPYVEAEAHRLLWLCVMTRWPETGDLQSMTILD